MSITQSLSFDNALNFTKVNTEIDGSIARLEIVPNPGQFFSEDFADDIGFTYDNTKAEFNAGILRQKDLRPTDSALAATYTSSKNLSWANSGSLVATDIGTPVLNAGKLECHGYANNAVQYSNANVGSNGDTGAIKLRYTPNYSGTPAQNITIVELAPTSGNANKMVLFHSSTGTLRLSAYNSAGVAQHSAATFGAAWSPVSGTEYEIEMNWDTTTGAIRLFVNGVLQGSMPATVYARSTTATLLYIGAGIVYPVANAAFNDVILFDTVQHTAGYTPGYTLPEFIYAGSKVDGPNFTYTGLGGVISLDDGSIVEVGTPRFIVGLKYWNGSAWVVSNGTYSQANSFAVVLANLTSFVTGGGGILPWSVVFTDSNTLSSVDEFEVEVTGQKYSPTGYIEPVQAVYAKELYSLAHDITETAGSFIKIILKLDGVLKYWNGSAWATSNGSFAQANTLAEVNTNIAELISSGNHEVFFRWVFTTSVNTETAEIATADIEYDFGALGVDPATCVVYGYLRDVSGAPVANASVRFNVVKSNSSQYKEAASAIIDGSVTVTTDDYGYFSCTLIRSSEYENGASYGIEIARGNTFSKVKNSGGVALTFTVDDAVTLDITSKLTA